MFDWILYTCIITVSYYFKVTLHTLHLVHEICRESISIISALSLLSVLTITWLWIKEAFDMHGNYWSISILSIKIYAVFEFTQRHSLLIVTN